MPDRSFAILLPGEGYYGAMAESLCAAFAELAIPARHYPVDRADLVDPRKRDVLRRTLAESKATDVLSVNLAKPQFPLGSEVTYHCWVQDPYDSEVESSACGDVVWMWVRHWVDWWGGRYLPPATDFGRYHEDEVGYDVDVSLAGVLPAAVVVGNHPVENLKIQKVVTATTRILGERKVFFCENRYAEKLFEEAQTVAKVTLRPECVTLVVRYIQVCLFRQVQRRQLLDHLVPICERRKWTLALAGPEWDRHPAYRRFHVGNIPAGTKLARFFRRSRINLHTNGDTNVHSRVLECLAAGGLVLSQAHPTDEEKGGLRSILGASAAPTFANAEDLEEKLAFYLADDEARKEAVSEGGEIVRRDHSYAERVKTLLAAI